MFENEDRPEGLKVEIPEDFDYDFVSELPAPEIPKEEERVVNLFPEMAEAKLEAIKLYNQKQQLEKAKIEQQLAQFKELQEFDNLQKNALNQSISVDLDEVNMEYYKYLSCGDFANIRFFNTLYFIGGYTNSGKSILARSILVHICKTDNIKVLYFTPETSIEQTATKLKEYEAIHRDDNLKKNIKNNVIFNDDVKTVDGVERKIKMWLLENPTGERVIMIDYMQMFQGVGKQCDIYPILTQKLLNLVKNTGISVFLFAQLRNKLKKDTDFKSRISNSYNCANAVQELVEISRDDNSPVKSLLTYHKTKQDIPLPETPIYYHPDCKMLLTDEPTEQSIENYSMKFGWKPINESSDDVEIFLKEDNNNGNA